MGLKYKGKIENPLDVVTKEYADGKVDKIVGKGLSTDDYVAADHYTDAEIDNMISSVTATFVGNFATKADLDAYTGTKKANDYAVVASDETHSNECWRYKYSGDAWVAEYRINESPMTDAQLAALNSGITAEKVTTYDGYAATIAEKEVRANKVTTLSSTSTDAEYPSAKCVYDILGDVETLINAL